MTYNDGVIFFGRRAGSDARLDVPVFAYNARQRNSCVEHLARRLDSELVVAIWECVTSSAGFG